MLNILIACEESQTICKEFRELGYNAFSCDLVECSGGHPEWHFKQDVIEVIYNKGGTLETGEEYYIDGNWDLMIAHPPCTFLSASGARWYYHPDDKDLPIEKRRPHPKYPHRAEDREDGAAFFMAMVNAPIPHIAIENPVGIMSTRYRKPDQIVQPFYFGDSARKTTCLWLKNLPTLESTDIVDQGEIITYSTGSKMPKWYAEASGKSKAERQKIRSKTFPGIAKAMAKQWSEYIDKK